MVRPPRSSRDPGISRTEGPSHEGLTSLNVLKPHVSSSIHLVLDFFGTQGRHVRLQLRLAQFALRLAL